MRDSCCGGWYKQAANGLEVCEAWNIFDSRFACLPWRSEPRLALRKPPPSRSRYLIAIDVSKDLGRPGFVRLTQLLQDNNTGHAAFWDHKHFQDRVVNLWQVIAKRYKSNPWVAGFNPMNEPADVEWTRLLSFYDRIVPAIREIDPEHILFLEGNT